MKDVSLVIPALISLIFFSVLVYPGCQKLPARFPDSVKSFLEASPLVASAFGRRCEASRRARQKASRTQDAASSTKASRNLVEIKVLIWLLG